MRFFSELAQISINFTYVQYVPTDFLIPLKAF